MSEAPSGENLGELARLKDASFVVPRYSSLMDALGGKTIEGLNRRVDLLECLCGSRVSAMRSLIRMGCARAAQGIDLPSDQQAENPLMKVFYPMGR